MCGIYETALRRILNRVEVLSGGGAIKMSAEADGRLSGERCRGEERCPGQISRGANVLGLPFN